jgi:hypothetical protein
VEHTVGMGQRMVVWDNPRGKAAWVAALGTVPCYDWGRRGFVGLYHPVRALAFVEFVVEFPRS